MPRCLAARRSTFPCVCQSDRARRGALSRGVRALGGGVDRGRRENGRRMLRDPTRPHSRPLRRHGRKLCHFQRIRCAGVAATGRCGGRWPHEIARLEEISEGGRSGTGLAVSRVQAKSALSARTGYPSPLALCARSQAGRFAVSGIGKPRACISHQLATAAADSTADSRPSPSGRLDVLPSTPSAPSGPRAANLRRSRRPRYASR